MACRCISLACGRPGGIGTGQDEIRTCTIITTVPNAVMELLHNRMPVILSDEDGDLWLDPDLTDVDKLQAMLAPCPDDDLYAYPISRLVNNVRNNGPEVVVPAA